ncbi:MAG: efflux RND transporter periplasmic adaptor subunit [Bryobacteraceae bacterium]|nr:efflux RND transporter periplasmic adaptor subunit [Bryobacteraceae bacterium]
MSHHYCHSQQVSAMKLLGLGACLAGLVWAAGCSSTRGAPSQPGPQSGNTSTPVAVARVVRQDLARELELAAEFRPWQEIDLHAKVSGYLKSMHVDVGDSVRSGELIAVLEVPEMAQDQVHAAAVLKRTTLDVERARGEVQRAEANLKIRKLSYDRLAAVVKSRPNLIAQQEIDDAAARLSEAQAQLAVAQAGLDSAQQQIGVSSAGKARTDAMASYLQLRAPFSGIITERRGDPGALVQAGTSSHTQALPVVRISHVDRLRLVLPIPESVVPRIRVGSPVEIRIDSLSRVFQGKVSRTSGRLDTSTRTMLTEVDVPNPGRTIRPGMYGYATLRLDRRDNALAAPVQALSGSDGTATVMVVSAGRLQDRRVQTGIETPNMVEILSGLQEGDLVVVGNRSRLKADMQVTPKVVDAPGAPESH